jgi:serine/threonine-protein kinase
VLKQLNHRHVVQVFDAGETPNQEHYLAMEYLEGRTLTKMVSKYGPLRADAVAPMLVQIASALDAAHSQGILHRDINPGNIMIVQGPNDKPLAKLLDFGLAKVREADKSKNELNVTGTGVILGNVAYMSPEQARGQKLKAATDIYALAATLYFALTGEAPFTHRTEIDVMLAHAQDPVPPFASKNPNNTVPPAAEKVVREAMAKQAGDRPQSAGEFAARFCVALGLAPPKYSSIQTTENTSKQSRPLGKWVYALIGAVIIGIGLATMFMQFRG